MLGLQIRVWSRGAKSHWVNYATFFVDCWQLIYKYHRRLFLFLPKGHQRKQRGKRNTKGHQWEPRGTEYHWVNPWSKFGRLLVVINQQCNKEELGVIFSKIQNLNWFLAVMKMLQLHYCFIFMETTLKNMTNKKWLQTYSFNPQYIQLKITSLSAHC